MLVIDDNKLKLLRMKEKLLEVSFDNKDTVLSEYKEIVLDIDRTMYDKLIDMIKNANYHDQPLETQLQYLTNLENEYNSYNEFQCRYRDIYERYASDKLALSPIEDVYIDKIKERIDAINGYLINKQNLERYRKILEELNIQLIDAEKKKDAIESRFGLLEKELKNAVLNAEGRIDNNGELEYASIPKEFEKYDLNLGNLLDDNILLEQELSDANNKLSSAKDDLAAVEVCFNNMPNDVETKTQYNASYFAVLNAHYRLDLLKLASLIANEYNDYENIRDKRFKIEIVLKDRMKLLNDLGIKFKADPFEKIKVDNQLEIIELLGKNLREVSYIKEKIKNNFDIVDGINAKNKELYAKISEDVKLFKDREIVSDTIDMDDTNVENIKNEDDDRKVVFVRNPAQSLNLDLVHGKTVGVIKRVYELFNSVPVEIKKDDVIPQLVIQKGTIFTDEANPQAIFEDKSAINNDLFSDSPITVSENSVFTDEVNTGNIFESDSPKDDINNDLFSELEPFKETVLFTNKYDDVFSGGQKNMAMPELLFEDEPEAFDDNTNDEQAINELPIDEQIKVLKLVA